MNGSLPKFPITFEPAPWKLMVGNSSEQVGEIGNGVPEKFPFQLFVNLWICAPNGSMWSLWPNEWKISHIYISFDFLKSKEYFDIKNLKIVSWPKRYDQNKGYICFFLQIFSVLAITFWPNKQFSSSICQNVH